MSKLPNHTSPAPDDSNSEESTTDNPRETFTPMLAPRGHVVHLVDGHWTICNRSVDAMTETVADDPRRTCRQCARGVPWALDLLQYRAERQHAEAEAAERRRAELERQRTKSEERKRAINVNLDLIREYNRRADLRAGRDPNRPRPTREDLNAELIALRAQNDQLEAEVSGAWRTYD